MDQLINDNFYACLFSTIFMGICLVCGGIYSLYASTKRMCNKNLRRILCIGISGILVCFWLWIFVYKNLSPILLAKCEYDNNVSVISTGIIEDVKYQSKDRIIITIDGAEYTIVYGSSNPFSKAMDKIIKKGTYALYSYGKKSKFIFDISKITPLPND